jgi:uncharacterized protein YaaW (UPF0174 family)
MKLNYKYDNGLEFIQYCSNEELNFFVELYKSEAKLTESLTSQSEYKEYFPNHHKYWKLIAAELQYFGGNTVLNTSRGYGVLYKEILCDVCSKELISYDKNADISQIEKVLIFEYLGKTIRNMSSQELQDFKNNLNLTQIDEIKLLNEIRKRLFTNKIFFQNTITILLSSLGNSIIKQVVKNILPLIAQKLLKKSVGLPIGVAINLKEIADPAFRITLPSVLFIVYLREKYKEKDLEFRHRFYPKIGSILRTELIAGGADHSGIYIRNNQIIEITEKNGSGCVEITDFNDFVHSSSARTGVTVYIAIDKLSKDIIFDNKIVNIANKHIGKKNKYQLMKNNCHSFVHKCIINEDFGKITSVWKFKHLTESISKNLNNNRPVQWVVCDINPIEYKKVKKWKIEDEVV